LSEAGYNKHVLANIYEQQRLSILEALLTTDAAGDVTVPACPAWTTADVVRHLIGLNDDWLTGNLEVYASPEWTSRQVERFAATPTGGLANAWDKRAATFERFLDDPTSLDHLPESIRTVIGAFPTTTFPGGIVVDLSQHTADVRSSLGIDPHPPEATLATCNRGMLGSLRYVWKLKELPSTQIVASDTGEAYRLGSEPHALRLEAPSYEIFRTVGGRRTTKQTAALSWRGPADAVASVTDHLVVPFFARPAESVELPSH
jgi:uncharacterized protein (TIGR03083 family)